MKTHQYYYMKWRTHSLRFILALAALSNCIVWAIVAGFYGNAGLAIGLCCGAAFALFVALIQRNEVETYHARYLRSLPTGYNPHDQ
jgi:xanthine/uracil permease